MLGRFSLPYQGGTWTMERDILDDTLIFFIVVQSSEYFILLHWDSVSVITPKG